VADQARAVKVVMVRAGIRQKRCIMANLLLCLVTPKTQEMAQREAVPKAENPLIRVLGSPEILAKASDF
jgi:precorrin isomerase